MPLNLPLAIIHTWDMVITLPPTARHLRSAAGHRWRGRRHGWHSLSPSCMYFKKLIGTFHGKLRVRLHARCTRYQLARAGHPASPFSPIQFQKTKCVHTNVRYKCALVHLVSSPYDRPLTSEIDRCWGWSLAYLEIDMLFRIPGHYTW